MTETPQELLDAYISDARDYLESIERQILKLAKGDTRSESLDVLFREVHSVKGGAFSLDLENVGRIGHLTEAVLELIRDGRLAPDPPIIDLLLEYVDCLGSMLVDAPHFGSRLDISSLYENFERLVPANVRSHIDLDPDPVTVEIFRNVDARRHRPQIKFRFTDYSIGELESDTQCYHLHFDVPPEAQAPKVLGRVEEFGAVIQALYNHDTDLPPPGSFMVADFLLASKLTREQLADQLHLPREHVMPLSLREVLDHSAMRAVTPRDDKQPLTAPPKASTVRIRLEILDRLMRLASELVLVRNQQLRMVDMNNDVARASAQRLDSLTTEIQNQVMATRMQPVRLIFSKLPRVVRELNRKLDKDIEIEISGEDVELDKAIIEALGDPLMHLINNCCDHGIEDRKTREQRGKISGGRIQVQAFHEGGMINIRISDDGGGMSAEVLKERAIRKGLLLAQDAQIMPDKEALALIFRPGFSTAEKVTEISGRGVGMDVVKDRIEQLGGTIEISSVWGTGTEISLHLPLTLAIIQCLVIQQGGFRYAVPQANLEELICLFPEDWSAKVECAGQREYLRYRNGLVPLIRLSDLLGRRNPLKEEDYAEIVGRAKKEPSRSKWDYVTVLRTGSKRLGLIVDEIKGTEEMVISPLHSAIKDLAIYSGATLMGDGSIALILDTVGICDFIGLPADHESHRGVERRARGREVEVPLLVFNTGPREHLALRQKDVRRIEFRRRADIQRVAGEEFVLVDGISTKVVYLDRVLGLSPCDRARDDFYLVIPKGNLSQVGFYVAELVDIGEYPLRFDGHEPDQEGIEGVILLRDQLISLLHADQLLRRVHDG